MQKLKALFKTQLIIWLDLLNKILTWYLVGIGLGAGLVMGFMCAVAILKFVS